MSTAQIALDQVKARRYDVPDHASGKQIILGGLAFHKAMRVSGKCKSEQRRTEN